MSNCEDKINKIVRSYEEKIEQLKIHYMYDIDRITNTDGLYYYQLGRDFERMLIQIDNNTILRHQWDKLMAYTKLTSE
jgi:hypothetical protein